MSNELTKWAQPTSAQEAKTLAGWVVKSGLYPKVRSEEQAIMILAQGAELGLRPVQSLNFINVIQGRPSLSSQGMLAVIMASGQAEGIWVSRIGPYACTWTTQRRSSAAGKQEVTFTMEEAKALGLAGRDQWKRQPAVMLKWRALAKLAREIYPDVIGGLYLTEELEGTEPDAEPELPRSGKLSSYGPRPEGLPPERPEPKQLPQGLASDPAEPTADIVPQLTDEDLTAAPFAEDWDTRQLAEHQQKLQRAQVSLVEVLHGADELARELWRTELTLDLEDVEPMQVPPMIQKARALYRRAEKWSLCWENHNALKGSPKPPDSPARVRVSALDEMLENYREMARAKGIKIKGVE